MMMKDFRQGLQTRGSSEVIKRQKMRIVLFVLLNFAYLDCDSSRLKFSKEFQLQKICNAVLFSYMMNLEGIPHELNSFSKKKQLECFVIPTIIDLKRCPLDNIQMWAFYFKFYRKGDNLGIFYKEINRNNPILMNNSNNCIPLFTLHGANRDYSLEACKNDINFIELDTSLKKFVSFIKEERYKINCILYLLLLKKGYPIDKSQVINFKPTDVIEMLHSKATNVKSIQI